VRRVARKIERDERAAGVSNDVRGTDTEMRQQLRRIRRGTRHETLGRSSDRRALPVATTPVMNLLNTSQRRLVHQREEGVRDPRAVYEQHRIAGAVHHVLDVSSVNWGPLQVSGSWHCGIMRLPACRETHAVYFACLSLEESAEALHVSVDTVKRDWRFAKLWLLRELSRH